MNLTEAKQILKEYGYNAYIGEESQFYKQRNWYLENLEKYRKKWQDAGIDVKGEWRYWESYYVLEFSIKLNDNEYYIKTYRSNTSPNPKIENNKYVDDPWDHWDNPGNWYGYIWVKNVSIKPITIPDKNSKKNEFETIDSIIDHLDEYCNVDNVRFAEFYDKLNILMDKYKQYGIDCKINKENDNYYIRDRVNYINGSIMFQMKKSYEDDSTEMKRRLTGHKFYLKIEFNYMFSPDGIITGGYKIPNNGNSYYDKCYDINGEKITKSNYEYGKTVLSEDEYINFIKSTINQYYKNSIKHILDYSKRAATASDNVKSWARKKNKSNVPKLFTWIKSLSGDKFRKGILSIYAQGQGDAFEENLLDYVAGKADDNGYKLSDDATAIMDYILDYYEYDSLKDMLEDREIDDFGKLIDFVYEYNYDCGEISEIEDYDY